MDTNTFFTGGASGLSLSIVCIALWKAYNYCNHKHIKSKCNGTQIDIELDVKDITPKEDGAGDKPDTK